MLFLSCLVGTQCSSAAWSLWTTPLVSATEDLLGEDCRALPDWPAQTTPSRQPQKETTLLFRGVLQQSRQSSLLKSNWIEHFGWLEEWNEHV
eukprot:s1629_g6.t1